MIQRKICILTTVHGAFDIRIFLKQACTLAKAGYRVVLSATLKESQTVENVYIDALPQPKNRLERIIVNGFRAFISALRNNADIYHFHDPELYLCGAFLKIFTGKKVIADAHEHYDKDIIAKEWIPLKYRKLYLFFFRLFEKISLPFIDAVIYVVPDIGDRFKAIGYKGRLVEIRNYPKLDALLPNEENYSSRKANKAIFFGGVYEVSGISQIIKAFSLVTQQIPDATLDIIGKIAPESYFDKLSALISELGMENNVFIHPPVAVNELTNYASQASIGLITYLPTSENNIIGLPNKIFEYMAFKLAVIASDFPLYREVITNSGSGYLVDPMNPADIAEKIVYLMQNPDICRELGDNGFKNVITTYNWDNEAKKLLDLYSSLLEGKS